MLRRSLLAALTGLAACGTRAVSPPPGEEIPSFLRGFDQDPAGGARAATLDWFQAAGRGLLFDYGVYSQLGRGPRVQFDERIPVARYSQLKSGFDPAGFNPEHLASLAMECGAGYVGLTARHADGFCLFRTIETDFNSLDVSGRDLLGELAEACEHRSLGLLLSYSYAADWRHPYFFPPNTSRTAWKESRPAYATPQPEYRFEGDEDFLHYVRFAHHQLQEIANRYPAIAGIRLEPLAGYRARPDLFPVGQAYSLLREARPEALISFGTGANGEEDFISTAIGSHQPVEGPVSLPKEKPAELCVSLGRGGPQGGSENHPTVPALREAARSAAAEGANLLLRLELLPDGSLAANHERLLLGLG